MVETLMLLSHQQAPATECIKAAGLPDKITVHLTDYRDIKRRPEGQHHFDRFINVEMIDNVWKKFIKTYWSVVDWALKSVDVCRSFRFPKEASGLIKSWRQYLTQVTCQERTSTTTMWTLYKNGHVTCYII